MTSPVPGIEESWSHAVAEIPGRGLDMRRQASAAERASLASTLEILAVDRLDVVYRIAQLGDGRYRLTGTISADVSQACVVSLEPVPSTLEDRMDVEFRVSLPPPGDAEEEGELSALEADEIEPVENGRIAVGRIVLETLAAALPAYPRAPGAELEQHEAGPAEPGGGPFSALAGWKPKQD
jgi:uncharacterized metal-binding protein YceD (DUF177 family)